MIKANVYVMRLLNFPANIITLSSLSKSVFSAIISAIIFVLSFAAICGNVFAQERDSAVIHHLPPLWPYHAFLVSLALIFMIAGMLAARYKKGRKNWLKLHKTLGLLGFALALAGITVAVYMVSSYLGVYFIKITHAYVGSVSLLLIILTPLTGFMQFRLKDRRMHVIHRLSGRLAILFMLANVLLGLQIVFG